jgi:hypothetical protein
MVRLLRGLGHGELDPDPSRERTTWMTLTIGRPALQIWAINMWAFEFLMTANGFGKDIWTLSQENINNVVMVSLQSYPQEALPS